MEKQTRDIAVAVENISKIYSTPDGELRVLNDINFQVNASETMAVVGVSGSGKSTLLALLAGLDVPTTGRIRLFGQNMSDGDEDERARIRSHHVGFVFQQFHLLPNLTALENVALPLELRDDPKAIANASATLDRVGLSQRRSHYPRQLSGGEQQRVAIARAYCATPKILFADEPTGNLDSATAAKITDLLFDLNKQSETTLILVTHDESLAQHCNRKIRLVDGQISERDAATDAR